jgi:hypothetical protein
MIGNVSPHPVAPRMGFSRRDRPHAAAVARARFYPDHRLRGCGPQGVRPTPASPFGSND